MTSFNKLYDMVLFHYPCQDGLCSAWVVHKYHRENNIDIELYPVSHGKTIDINMLKNKKIIMCDYSPSVEVLEQIEQVAQSVTILDHHVTAKNALETKPYAIFNMEKSGAGITWEYFYPDVPVPEFIQMVQDRDLWKWEISGSKEFTAGLFTICATIDSNNFPELFNIFTQMHTEPTKVQFYKDLGKIMSTITDNKAKALGDDHMGTVSNFVFQSKTYRVCVVNCFPDITSEAGNYISKSDQIDFAVLWRHHNPTGEFYVSLRSTGDIDVSIIAKIFGGGGHPNAAGFNTKVFPPTLFAPVFGQKFNNQP